MDDECPKPKCENHLSKAKIKCKTKEELTEKQCQKTVENKKNDAGTPKIFETPRFMRIIGPKQVEAYAQFIPSVLIYSAATILATLYFTEWKAVLQYLPYYSSKYKKSDE